MRNTDSPRTLLIHEFVTGGGMAEQVLPPSWAAEGGAMRRALTRDFASVPSIRVVMTLDERLEEPSGPWRVVAVGPGEEQAVIRSWASRVDATLMIAPETNGCLQERARWIEESGGGSLGCRSEAIHMTANKLRCNNWLREHGVPAVMGQSVNPRAGLPPTAHYPAILKPIDGAGCLLTFEVPGPDQCPEEARELDLALLEPDLAGETLSALLMVDGSKCAQLIGIGRQTIVREHGRLSYNGGVFPIAWDGPAEVLRRAIDVIPGRSGFFGVDFLWNPVDRTVIVVEINPRPTTSLVGLTGLLPPGRFASAWLACARPWREAERFDSGELILALARELSGRVAQPVEFAPDGRLTWHRIGVELENESP